MSEDVELSKISLGDILSKDELTIPDYQRIYCWEEKNVYQLLEDVKNITSTFHLGNIIVHNNNNKLDIIDGQQRLVTLSLILYVLEGSDENNHLLNQQFNSSLAQQYIKYNYSIIKRDLDSYCEREALADNLRKKIQFSLLTINGNLDLAYTFFTSQNALGVKLSDYDLLKSHHLRYVYRDEQALHIAQNWDRILLNGNKKDSKGNKIQPSLKETMGMYLYRLRKWYKHEDWYEKTPYIVKEEFEADPIISEIPPFGEQFKYYEPIQGGTHFFAYTDIFIDRLKQFQSTPSYKSLNTHIRGESHGRFRNIIEVLLFAYYLKFGDYYLSEALYCITVMVSHYRLEHARYNYHELLNKQINKEIVSFIERSTSPTFFLAYSINKINKMVIKVGEFGKGIRYRYYKYMINLFKEIQNNFTSDTVMLSYKKLPKLEEKN